MANLTEHVILNKWNNDINNAITDVGGNTIGAVGIGDYSEIIHNQLISKTAANVIQFKGVYDNLEDVENPSNGDLVIIGEIEYVYFNDWVELGNTTASTALRVENPLIIHTPDGDISYDGSTPNVEITIEEVEPVVTLIETTYAELKNLRDNNQLVPGTKYRITDYVTTATGTFVTSAQHKFDIIVTALTNNTLSQSAKAIHSKSDFELTGNIFSWPDINNWEDTNSSSIPQEILNISPTTVAKQQGSRYTAQHFNAGDIIRVTITGYTGDYQDSSVQEDVKGLGASLHIRRTNELLSIDYGYDKDVYYLQVPKNIEDNTEIAIRFYIDSAANTANTGQCGAIADKGKRYFENSDLSAWEIKYCLDNDTNRFGWAKPDGKGVIYHMKDELNNECPYDFKNIQYLRSGVYYYTFSIQVNNGSIQDQTVINPDLGVNEYTHAKCYGNIIRPYLWNGGGIGDLTYQDLNSIIFKNRVDSDHYCYNNIFGNYCYSNTFGTGCRNNTFRNGCGNNTIGNSCYNNTFGDSCNSNTFGQACSYNTLGNRCVNNKFNTTGGIGDGCTYNTLGNDCNNNTFAYQCHYNNFGNECDYNTFGNNCQENTFESGCNNNTFGSGCNNNTFGNRCVGNKFNTTGSIVAGCTYNTLGDDCNTNTFTIRCHYNTFGNHCLHNTFGDSCNNNTFGNECSRNKFGYEYQENTFGNNCNDNIFGNNCHHNTFGDNYRDNKVGNVCHHNTFGDGCYYNNFGNACIHNTFGNNYINNIFGNAGQYNTFGNNCSNNDFRDYCDCNTFGNGCNNNTFGYSCDWNKFGDDCHDNTFGDSVIIGSNCEHNILGVGCANIDFGAECNFNTLGKYCNLIEMGDYCTSNNISDECEESRFGANCHQNSLDVKCSSIHLEDFCHCNTFGCSVGSVGFDPDCDKNKIGNFGNNITIGESCTSNTFGDNNQDIFFDHSCSSNSLGNDNQSISFDHSCSSNIVGDKNQNNTFGKNCMQNTIGNSCLNNNFKDDCSYNVLGDMSSRNNFGNSCTWNIFGQQCSDNGIDFYCVGNKFGQQCSGNGLDMYSEYNTLGDNCTDNQLDESCTHNRFGDNCIGNMLSAYCANNVFANHCTRNRFGYNCSLSTINANSSLIEIGDDNNTIIFGEHCRNIKIETLDGSRWVPSFYMNNIRVGDNCQNLNICFWTFDQINVTNNLQNYTITSGLSGTTTLPLTIQFDDRSSASLIGRNYETKAARDSQGNIRIYCEADLFNSMDKLLTSSIGISYTTTLEEKSTIDAVYDDKMLVINASDDCILKSLHFHSLFEGKDYWTAAALIMRGRIIGLDSQICDSWGNLVKVEIPDSVTSIGDNAFYGCGKLTHIEIPNSVTNIDMYAFAMSGLKSITCKAIIPPTLGANVFYNNSIDVVYVPAESVDTYKNHEGWGVFGDKIQAIPE